MAAKDLAIKAVIRAKDRLTGPVKRAAASVRRHLAPALAQARRAASRLGGAFGKLNSVLGLLGIGGLALSGAGLLKLAKDHAAALDEVGKFSRQINVTVESLQELDYAMARQGLSTEVLRNGLNTLNTRLGESKAGLGKLHTFLKRMPRAFREQIKAAKDTDEAFRIIIGAINKVEDPAKKAALASVFFGKAIGPQMLRMAEVGVDGLAQLRKEAHKYGIANREQTDAAEAFVDSQENMNRSIAGLKIKIGSALLPILKPLIDRITDWGQANKGLIAAKVSEWVERVVTAFQNIDWERIRAGWQDVKDTAKAVGGVLGWVYDRLKDVAVVLGEVAAIATLAGMELWGSLGETIERVKTAWNNGDLGGVIKGVLGGVWKIIKAAVALNVKILRRLTPQVVLDAWDGMVEWFRGLWAKVVQLGKDAIEEVKDLILAVPRAVEGLAVDLGLSDGVSLNTGKLVALQQQLRVVQQTARPQVAARGTQGAVAVDVRILSDGDQRVRANTRTTGSGVQAKTTTSTAPTGTRGVGLPAGAGVAP